MANVHRLSKHRTLWWSVFIFSTTAWQQQDKTELYLSWEKLLTDDTNTISQIQNSVWPVAKKKIYIKGPLFQLNPHITRNFIDPWKYGFRYLKIFKENCQSLKALCRRLKVCMLILIKSDTEDTDISLKNLLKNWSYHSQWAWLQHGHVTGSHSLTEADLHPLSSLTQVGQRSI